MKIMNSECVLVWSFFFFKNEDPSYKPKNTVNILINVFHCGHVGFQVIILRPEAYWRLCFSAFFFNVKNILYD